MDNSEGPFREIRFHQFAQIFWKRTFHFVDETVMSYLVEGVRHIDKDCSRILFFSRALAMFATTLWICSVMACWSLKPIHVRLDMLQEDFFEQLGNSREQGSGLYDPLLLEFRSLLFPLP